MAQEEDRHSLEAKFAAAVKVIRSLPEEGPFQPSDDMMLMFYSYYKQATLGPCDIPRPSGFWDSHEKTKWDAWSALGNMTKEEAMRNYVEDIQLILETIPISDEVSDLVQKLGSFYAEVEGDEAGEEEATARPFTRPFANHAVWRPDSRLRTAEDKRWRSDTSSSVEPSVSSITNGTHSSLNSEVEEEELACSIEASAQNNAYMHFNGRLSDHRDSAPEKNLRSTDSDNEEFCDSMEHLAMEEGLSTSKPHSPGSEAASVRQHDLWFESNSTLNGGEDPGLIGDSYFNGRSSTTNHNGCLSRRERGFQSPKMACGSQLCVSVDAAYCCVSHRRRPDIAPGADINEQIATALLRLQHDMSNVLHRLHTLEVLTVSQSRSSSPRQEDSLPVARKLLRPSWWPFDYAPLTVALTALWPLIAHWLIQLYLQRKRRKIP